MSGAAACRAERGRWQRAGRLLGTALLAPLAFAAATALADDEARHWLEGMNEALAARNYQGEFLHLHLPDGRVEKLRILHRVKDGRVSERLVSLTGNGRELVSNDTEVQCYLPDQRKVLVETRSERGPLLGTLPRFDADVENNYRVELAGRVVSVLGRPAHIVAVNPRDAYRYGYRVWIDEEWHMPVRTDLCDAQGNVLETVLFTSLAVGVALADADFRPAVQAESYSWIRQGRSRRRAADDMPWRLLQLPPGFRLSSSGERLMPGSEQPAMHLVLSDGLATVSVFIEQSAAARPDAEGQGRVGPASAFSRLVGGLKVTAVGEVPPQTVKFIAGGVAPAPAAARTPAAARQQQ